MTPLLLDLAQPIVNTRFLLSVKRPLCHVQVALTRLLHPTPRYQSAQPWFRSMPTVDRSHCFRFDLQGIACLVSCVCVCLCVCPSRPAVAVNLPTGLHACVQPGQVERVPARVPCRRVLCRLHVPRPLLPRIVSRDWYGAVILRCTGCLTSTADQGFHVHPAPAQQLCRL